MLKRRVQEEPDKADRWLLTYADMITLLMAFFIMMYSMSVLNLSRFKEAAIAIRSGFNGSIQGKGRSVLNSGATVGTKLTAQGSESQGISWQSIQPLVDATQNGSLGKDGAVSIYQDDRGVVITVRSDDLLFEPSQARPRSEALPLLDRIAETLDNCDNMVQIEGHTCNLPPRGSRYSSNWELSTARATSVLRYLVEDKGLMAQRFSASGCGSMRPIASNDTSAGRKKNRRVEMIILRKPSALGRSSLEPTRESIRRRSSIDSQQQ